MIPTPPSQPHDDTSPGLSARDVDTLLESVAKRTVDRPATWRDRLRELPTATRTVAAIGAAIGIGGLAVVLTGPRTDLDAAGWARLGLGISPAVAAIAAAVALALRGVHRRALVGAAAVALALLVAPVALALLPGVWPGTNVSVLPQALAIDVACFAQGLVTAGAVVAVLRPISRADRPGPVEIAARAAAGGAVAFASLAAACGANDPLHLVAAHGIAGLLGGAVGFAGAALRAGLRRG